MRAWTQAIAGSFAYDILAGVRHALVHRDYSELRGLMLAADGARPYPATVRVFPRRNTEMELRRATDIPGLVKHSRDWILSFVRALGEMAGTVYRRRPSQAAERADDELACLAPDEDVPRALAAPPRQDDDGAASLEVGPANHRALPFHSDSAVPCRNPWPTTTTLKDRMVFLPVAPDSG